MGRDGIEDLSRGLMLGKTTESPCRDGSCLNSFPPFLLPALCVVGPRVIFVWQPVSDSLDIGIPGVP